MKRATLFEKFEELVDVPNAVEKIRELVLRMATSGCIAEQDPTDVPASQLLEEIVTQRDKLIAQGLVRSRVEGNPISAGDTTEIPASWVRCMISEVCDLQTGATPSRQEHQYFGGDIPWLVSGDINRGEIVECEGRITELGLQNSNCRIIPPNSVLIALNGQGKTRGTVAVLRIPAALNQSLLAMIPYSRERLLPEYIFWNLRGRYYAIREITGQDQRRGLNMKIVGQLSLPLPPVAEQKRIVAKLDELMALCDQLEAQQQQRAIRQSVLARAALARFGDAPGPANLSYLFHESFNVSPSDLRGTILSLAIQGRLVPQDSDDLPVQGFANSQSTKGVQPIGEKEIPFEVPVSWNWVRLGCIAEFINGDRGKNYPNKAEYVPSGVPFINTGHIRPDGTLSMEWMHYLTRAKFESLRSGKVRKGDLVYCLRGATLGKTAIISQFDEGAVASSLVIIRLREQVIPRYGYFYLISPLGRELIKRFDNGSAQPNLSANSVKRFVTPVPPLAEQHRIVTKVDQLFGLVNILEAKLAASQNVGVKLLDALVAELTGEGSERSFL